MKPLLLLSLTVLFSHSTALPSSPSAPCPPLIPNLIAPQSTFLLSTTSPSTPATPPSPSVPVSVSPSSVAIFNFAIPASFTGYCSQLFLLPIHSDPAVTITGYKVFEFGKLDSLASNTTTYANMGAVNVIAETTLFPGVEVATLSTLPCLAGQEISIVVSAPLGDTLEYGGGEGACGGAVGPFIRHVEGS